MNKGPSISKQSTPFDRSKAVIQEFEEKARVEEEALNG